MVIISIIICILGLYYLNKGDHAKFLACLFSVETGFGFVDANNPILKTTDLFLLLTLAATIKGVRCNSNFFNVKNDVIGKVVLLIIVYEFLSFVFTVILGLDTLAYSFKWYRKYLCVVLYFYFRSLSYEDIKRFIRYIFVLSVIQGVLFYAQVVTGVQILAGRIDEAESSEEITRYLNYPTWAIFILLYTFIRQDINLTKKTLWLMFWGAMLILAQTRGGIITTAVAIGVFFISQRKIIYVIYVALLGVLFQFAIKPMFEYRDVNNNQSAFEEVLTTINDPLNAHHNYHDARDGNFAFRIAVLAERIEFMQQNPKYLPFGVGMIHEDSPNNNYNFAFGTLSPSRKYGIEMLASGDIDWVEFLMRLGIIGCILYSILLFVWAQKGITNVSQSNDVLFTTVALLSISSILNTFNSPPFRHDTALIMFYLAVVNIYLSKESRQDVLVC